MDTNIQLGNNLRYYRKQSGLTLKEMSEKIDISLGTYQKYETGLIKHIDIDIVKQFAKALNISPETLLGWTQVDMISKDNLLIEKKDDTAAKAFELYKLYENATPEAKQLVENFLKSSQQES